MTHHDQTTAKDVDLKSIIGILHRQRRVIAMTTAFFFGLAGLFLFTVSEIYTATALVLVDPNGKNILTPQPGFSNSAGQDSAQVDSQVEILRSDAVAQAVIVENNLMTDPEFGARISFVERLGRAVGVANASFASRDQALSRTLARFQDATAIRRRGLTYLISVSASSRSPQQAAVLANGLTHAYIQQQVQAKVSDTLAARNVIRRQIEDSTQALAAYETAVDDVLVKNLDTLDQANLDPRLNTLRQSIQAAQAERDQIQQVSNRVRQLRQQEDWSGLAVILQDPLLGELGAKRAEILQNMTTPLAAEPKADLHQALAEIDRRLNEQTVARLSVLRGQVASADTDISGLRAQLRDSALSGDLPPEMLAEIYAVQQESAIARDQYQTLLSRLRDLETQARIQLADSRVVSPALAPIRPTFPNRTLVLLAAMAASLGVGVSLAFLKEYYIGGVTSVTQLADLMQTSGGAMVPHNPDQGTDRLSLADDIIDAPLSIYSESMRKLRAAFDQAFRTQDGLTQPEGPKLGKIILVTSAQEDEGKTTTALALARTFAQSGRKTLLIDADLRRPSLHRQLGFEPQVGFLDYLSGAPESEQSGTFYAKDPASSLALIMGAERSEFPTDQLLCSPRFETLLAQGREIYEIVIVDSSPLLPVVDARYIANQADGVAMVVKWASTGQSDLRNAIMPLRESLRPGAVLVPVLSQVRDLSQYRASTSYYSGYSAAI